MKLNNTHKAFLELVRAGLWEEETRLLSYSNIDFNEIYRLAEEQSVIGLVTAGLEHVTDVKVPQMIVLNFVGSALQIEQRNTILNTFVGEIIKELRDADIYTLLLKGQGIAQCYERPLWRASGDVDLFLSDINYKKAKDSLIKKSSNVEDEDMETQHLGMMIDQWEVELHGTLRCGISLRSDKGLDRIKKELFGGNVRSWMNGNTQILLPRVDEDVVYVFSHILQHFFNEGIGLRQICDWCRLLWKFRDSLNHTLLESRIRKMGLMTEWKAFSAFAVDYLGMPAESMPFYSQKNIWKHKADKIWDFVIEVGNFGHNKQKEPISRPIIIRKLYTAGNMIKYTLRHFRLFPMGSVRTCLYQLFLGVKYQF